MKTLILLLILLGACVIKALPQSVEIGMNYSANYAVDKHVSGSIAFNSPTWGVYVKTYPHNQWEKDKDANDYFVTEKSATIGVLRCINRLQLHVGVGKSRQYVHNIDDSWIVLNAVAYEGGFGYKIVDRGLLSVRIDANLIHTFNLMVYSGASIGIKIK